MEVREITSINTYGRIVRKQYLPKEIIVRCGNNTEHIVKYENIFIYSFEDQVLYLDKQDDLYDVVTINGKQIHNYIDLFDAIYFT